MRSSATLPKPLERRLTTRSNLTSGCLFAEHRYAQPHLGAAAGVHSCRYFDAPLMRRLCGSLSRGGDKPDYRGDTYAEQYLPWFCKGV